jgi:hypothetical protein
MSLARKANITLSGSMAVLFALAITADAQQPAKSAAKTRPAPESEEKYELRTYDVGDLVISIQDHPYSEALIGVPGPQGGGFGGGGLGGGRGGGGFGGGGGGGYFSVPNANLSPAEQSKSFNGKSPIVMLCQSGGPTVGGIKNAPRQSSAAKPDGDTSITIGDIVRVLVETVDVNSWALNGGGDGTVQPLGTVLVVWQHPSVHTHIEDLLHQIRQTSSQRKTLTVDARWLLLNSDDLDSLLVKDSHDVPQVDRKALAGFTRRPGSIRGLTNCYSGQLVYILSGTQRSFVVGQIPVVGALERNDRDTSLASLDGRPRIQLVQFTGKSGNVGYQPIVTSPNFGAVLEIRPTAIYGAKSDVVVELKSTLTAPGESSPQPARKSAEEGGPPPVDRLAIETQDFATTLRVPLGKPVLVGGMTNTSGLAKAGDGAKASERPQLYLVLEIR